MHRRYFGPTIFWALGLTLTAVAAEPSPPSETPAIRRLLLTPDRLPAEMARLKQGVLQQMDREEFERLVQQAARRQATLRNPPRLVQAHYQAILLDSALHGAGQWQVIHPGPDANLLNLAPCNLALDRLPRYAGGSRADQPAILAEFDGKQPALLLEEPGEQTLQLEWSARATARPEGLHFDLRLPPAPAAVLDLYVPADWTVTAPDGVLVAGPASPPAGPDPALERVLASRTDGQSVLLSKVRTDGRLWKVHTGGRSQLPLLLRPPKKGGQAPVLLVRRQQTTQTLYPDALEARYEFDLEALHEGVRELVCECDPGLRPVDVSMRNLARWQVKPGGPDGSTLVLIHLDSAFREGTLQVDCLAPLGPPGKMEAAPVNWVSPGARLAGAVPRGESLVLRFHPDLRMDSWRPGSFRVLDTAVDKDPERGINLQRLTLAGGGVLPAGAPAGPAGSVSDRSRPAARLQTRGVEYRARLLSWWRLDSQPMRLQLQIDYEVSHGQLFQLPVQLPVGWDVEAVEIAPQKSEAPARGPAGLNLSWRVRRDQKLPPLLLVDLERPLRSRSPGSRLTVRLRPAQPMPIIGKLLAFPEAMALGARFQEGALAVSLDDQNHQLVRSQASNPSADPDEEGPWGKDLPEYFYPYRGKQVQGSLLLQQRPVQLRARCLNKVFLASGRAALETQLWLEAEAGSTEAIDLSIPSVAGGPWSWQGGEPGASATGVRERQRPEPVRRAERLVVVEVAAALAGLAARQPLELSCLQAAWPNGERWRLHLARPLHRGEPLLLQATRPLPYQDGQWEVPLPTVLGASRMEGEAALHLAGEDLVQVETVGLREGPPNVVSRLRFHGELAWRTFRYSDKSPPVLILRGQRTGADRSNLVLAPWASLTSSLTPGGGLQHQLRFQVANWTQKTLPVTLPAGVRPVAVQVDGRWLDHLDLGRMDANGQPHLELPVPVLAASPEFAPGDRAAPARGGVLGFLVPPAAAAARPHEEGLAPRTVVYEIIYVEEAASPLLASTLTVATPALPVQPLAFRRIWRLPPGLVPWSTEGLQRLPSPGSGCEGLLALGRSKPLELVRAAAGWPGGWSALTGARSRDGDTVVLADVVRAFRSSRRGGQPLAFREVAEEMSGRLAQAQEKRPLLLDLWALREAGARGDTVVNVSPPASSGDNAAPWESLGLGILPCRSALLLTSQRQRQLWLQESGSGILPASAGRATLEEALAQAQLHGQDPSGRYRTLAGWLGSSLNGSEGTGQPELAERQLLAPGASLQGWTEWEVVRDPDSTGKLELVRRDTVVSLGGLLALVLVLVFWRLRRASGRWRLTYLWLWLALAGLAWLWLPEALQPLAWPPLVGGVVLALVWYLWLILRRPASPPAPTSVRAASPKTSPAGSLSSGGSSKSGRPAVPGVGLTGVLILLALNSIPSLTPRTWVYAWSAPAGPVTVYLLPASATPSSKESVLVPVELVEQLQTQAQPASWMNGAVLLSARYQGEVVNGAVHFKAAFEAYSLSEEPTLLALPLEGDLEGTQWLDNMQVDPVLLPRPQTGFGLTVRGKGRHTVELQLRVQVAKADARQGETGDERWLRFAAPRLLPSRLSLKVPAPAAYLQTVTRQGWERVGGGPEAMLLEVELGRLAEPAPVQGQPAKPVPVQVRWFPEAEMARTARVQLREAYLWDLRAEFSTLTALLHYQVTQGSVTSLHIDLPAELEVRGVEMFRAKEGPVRGWDWRVGQKGSARTLYLDFPGPLRGEYLAALDLVPRGPLPASVTLVLPTPQGISEAGFLAYKSSDLDIQRGNPPLRVTGIENDDFAPFWPASWPAAWQATPPTRPDPRSLIHSCTFRREAGKPPLLHLHLAPLVPRPNAIQEVHVRVGPSLAQAEVRAVLDLTVPKGDLALVEWDLGPGPLVTVAALTGTEVRAWSQNGSRVLVRLGRKLAKAHLELTGWVTLPRDGNRSRLDLPCLRVPGANSQKTTVRLATAGDLTLGTPTLRQLLPVEDQKIKPALERLYQTEQSVYGGSWPIVPGGAGSAVQVLTLVEVVDRQLRFRSQIVCQSQPGEARTIQIQLRDWEGAKVELVSGAVPQRLRKTARGERIWTVDLPASPLRSYSFTLKGETPLSEAAVGLWMPDVTVADVGRSERWLALVGPELLAEEAQCVAVVVDLNQALRAWPAGAWSSEVERLRKAAGQVWRIMGPKWKLWLSPRERPGVAAQVYLAEHTAAVVDGRSWLHEIRYWVAHESSTELSLTMPAKARFVAAAIDGVDVVPLQPQEDQLWLPLPGRVGVREVRLRWRYDAESLEEPNLARPRLTASPEGPTVWTVQAPPRLVPDAGDLAPGPAQAATADLVCAEAHLKACARLVDAERSPETAGPVRDQLVMAQQHFAWHCRQAELNLAAAALTTAAPILGPNGQKLSDWLGELQEANRKLAHDHDFERLRSQADQLARSRLGPPRSVGLTPGPLFFPMSEQGSPYHGQASADMALPRLQLLPQVRLQRREVLAASGEWLGLLGLMWLLSLVPFLLVWARRLWPEHLALLALVLGSLVGLTPLVAGLVLAWLGIRLAPIARRLRPLPPAPRPSRISST